MLLKVKWQVFNKNEALNLALCSLSFTCTITTATEGLFTHETLLAVNIIE